MLPLPLPGERLSNVMFPVMVVAVPVPKGRPREDEEEKGVSLSVALAKVVMFVPVPVAVLPVPGREDTVFAVCGLGSVWPIPRVRFHSLRRSCSRSHFTAYNWA